MSKIKVFNLSDPKLELVGSELANETARKIINELLSGPKSASEIAEAIGSPINTVMFHLNKMVESGIVRLVGISPGRRGQKKIYELTSRILIIAPHEDEASLLEELRRTISKLEIPRWSVVRPVVISVLIAFLLWGVFLGSSFRGAMAPASKVKTLVIAGEAAGRKNASVRNTFSGGSYRQPNYVMVLVLLLAASVAAALCSVILIKRQALAVNKPLKSSNVIPAGETEQEADPLSSDGAVNGVL